MSNLAKHIHDEKNGLDYTLYGDYYLPDLGVEPGYPLGKYEIQSNVNHKVHVTLYFLSLFLSA